MTKHSIGITLLFTAALSWGCTEGRTADLMPLTPVKIQAAESVAVDNGGLRYSATIRPSAQMELAFRNGGFVDSIHHVGGRLIDLGDTVAAGTLLASLRSADFEHRLDQTESQLQEARASLESAKARAEDNQVRYTRAELDFNRAQQLYDSRSLTKTNYDAARADYDSARTKLDSASADIESAQSRIRSAEAAVADAKLALQDAGIVAPMTGTILERSVEIGSLVGSGRRAFLLADMRTVKAVFGVPDLEIRNVRPGMVLTVTSEALPEQTFTGRITSVSPLADEKSRIFETEVTIANPRGTLKAGMIASVVVGNTGPAESIVAVPLSSIIRSKENPENYAVYVVDTGAGQAIARLRPVTLGDAVGNRIAVESGLEVGEYVISLGTTLVHDGEAVQIVP